MCGSRAIDLDDRPTPFLLEASEDGESWIVLDDARATVANRSYDWVTLDKPRPFRFVRVTGGAQPYGSSFAVSGLRVFGKGGGRLALRPTRAGSLDVIVDWPAVPTARGHNVRWGIAADKLYSCWQVGEGTTRLDLGALKAGTDYWVAVDSFNENGVTRGRPVAVPVWAG